MLTQCDRMMPPGMGSCRAVQCRRTVRLSGHTMLQTCRLDSPVGVRLDAQRAVACTWHGCSSRLPSRLVSARSPAVASNTSKTARASVRAGQAGRRRPQRARRVQVPDPAQRRQARLRAQPDQRQDRAPAHRLRRVRRGDPVLAGAGHAAKIRAELNASPPPTRATAGTPPRSASSTRASSRPDLHAPFTTAARHTVRPAAVSHPLSCRAGLRSVAPAGDRLAAFYRNVHRLSGSGSRRLRGSSA